MHLGGKIEVVPRSPVKTRDDLSMAYTPGVARVSQAIADDPAKVWTLTTKQHMVAIVTDGSAVLGLGDIGPEAALPVMEGKSMLFKGFGDVDAFPIGSRRGSRTRSSRRSRQSHRGSAASTSRTSPRPGASKSRRGSRPSSTSPCSTTTSTARRSSCSRRFSTHLEWSENGSRKSNRDEYRRRRRRHRGDKNPARRGARWIVGCDAEARSTAAGEPERRKSEYAELTNPDGSAARPTRCSRAPTSSSASRAGAIAAGVGRMARGRSFRVANPRRGDPEEIEDLAAVIATGRSDYPNQINNVLAFPGVFRGALDVRAPRSPMGCRSQPETRWPA